MPKFTVTLFGGPYDCEKKDFEYEGDSLPPTIGLDVLDDQSLIAEYQWTNPEGGTPIFEFVQFRNRVIGGSGNKEERSIVWREDQSPFEGDKPSQYAIDNWIGDVMGASPRQIKVGLNPHDPAVFNRWFKAHWHLECDPTCKMYGVDPTKFHCALMSSWYEWADGKRHSALWSNVPRPGESTADFMQRRKLERMKSWGSLYGMGADKMRKSTEDFNKGMGDLKDAVEELSKLSRRNREAKIYTDTLAMLFQNPGMYQYLNLGSLAAELGVTEVELRAAVDDYQKIQFMPAFDAAEMLRKFHEAYPGVKDFSKKLKADPAYKKYNLTDMEMQFHEGRKWTREEIYRAYGMHVDLAKDGSDLNVEYVALYRKFT